ncbi:nucleoid-associated protein YgaU [Bradyrhizobium japonicum]|uniref:CIS tube protein n=1 Tax=Bradyrhizobium japonicum TaxID=375 RepID=UPI0021677F40|nr:LysM peptidoglycan-binding domain-containing protein [Bradyrhizobium japonicum]MCS3499336.1 nucleoid-associated protein YgaU [Bradyrhizobium japonicum]MCS3958500.1 nucleoid-associated protein YgaU [Bradyrhizobium japonicum]MCS4000254.1 nucleoid-associated protein YgaU [Bradyrhizobium japonicum]
MATLEKAVIEVLAGSRAGQPPIAVLFNPTEYTRERSNAYKATAVPGLSSPLIQFVNGEADVLSMELFLDDYTDVDQPGARGPKKPVNERVKDIAALLDIDRDLHAPSPVRFLWGPLRFDAVIEKLSQKFTLFRPDGTPARATLSVTFKEYLPLARQLRDPRRESADKSKRRQLTASEDIWLLASVEYGDPALWRTIVDAPGNDIDDPWRLGPGDWLIVPPLENGNGSSNTV